MNDQRQSAQFTSPQLFQLDGAPLCKRVANIQMLLERRTEDPRDVNPITGENALSFAIRLHSEEVGRNGHVSNKSMAYKESKDTLKVWIDCQNAQDAIQDVLKKFGSSRILQP